MGTPVVLGRVSGVYGVTGWVKVHSYTQPRANILRYTPWRLYLDGGWCLTELQAGRGQGRGVVAKLDLSDDRDGARRLIGADIAVGREQLPATGEDEYYWVELIGFEVVTAAGASLGRLQDFMETGANPVMRVQGAQRERLIPFTRDVVLAVATKAGYIQVDWDPEF